MAIQVTSQRYADRPAIAITATVSDSDMMLNRVQDAILANICERIAERYVEEHYAEIAARLDQNAIANLAIADAGKKIAEEIRTKPTVIREPGNRTVVNKFSIL